MLQYALLCCGCVSAKLCCAILCYAMLCYSMLCYAMLCYAMLCYVMLCCAIPCCAVLLLCYAVPCCPTIEGAGVVLGLRLCHPLSGHLIGNPSTCRYIVSRNHNALHSPHTSHLLSPTLNLTRCYAMRCCATPYYVVLCCRNPVRHCTFLPWSPPP